MTLSDVVIQYEGRLQDLQAGITNGRVLDTASALVLAGAVAVFLLLSLYAIAIARMAGSSLVNFGLRSIET